MKAAVYLEYGEPEVVHIKELSVPIPKSHEVLIRVHATTVNRTDCGFRKPEYFIVRLINGMFKPRKTILGTEFSGTIVQRGTDVTLFAVGEEVFGLNTFNFGTHAEYICIPEHTSMAVKPANMSHIEAAAVCDGLMMALSFFKNLDFHQPRKILINGASGSIGSACVQLARYHGADITAVCNPQDLDLLKSLGADKVMDYTREDFTAGTEQYDYILDAVGKSSFSKCKKILKHQGMYISSELGEWAQNLFLHVWTSMFARQKVKFPIPSITLKDIHFFKALIETNNYKTVIDRIYTIDEIVEAHKYVELGQKTGNVVISLESQL